MIRFLLRAVLGGLFIVAAIAKGLDDAAFALELKTLLLPVVSLITDTTLNAQHFMTALDLKHCGCFGQLWNEPLDAWSLVRNATLFWMCVGIYFTSTQTTRPYATMADKT